MFKLLALLLAIVFLSGCAALLNSDRPRFSGHIVTPLWTVPNLAVSKLPVIHEGIVYVQPIESHETHLYAFELKTGKQLWAAKFPTDQIIAVVGPRLLVTDDKGLLHALDSKTGREFEPPARTNLLSATATDNILYVVGQDRSVSAMDSPAHTLWTAHVPMNYLFHPVVAGGNVYIFGQSKDDKGVKLGCAVHAFDVKSGALRWKWETQDCSGPEDSPISFLLADGDAAYIAIDDKTVDDKAGMVIAFDAATGKQKWTSRTVEFHYEGPALFDPSTILVCDNIPGDHGGTATRKNPYVLRGLNRATGQTMWETRTRWKYSQWTAHDGLLFVADRKAHAMINTGNETSPDSFLTVADIRTGKELWRSETVTLGSFTTPVIEDGIAVFGSLPFGDENPSAAGLFAFRASRTGK